MCSCIRDCRETQLLDFSEHRVEERTIPHPNWRQFVQEKGTPYRKFNESSAKWNRILIHWIEMKKNGKILNHTFSPILNLNNGAIYNNNTVSAIAIKSLCLSVAAIPWYALKVVYHLTIGWIREPWRALEVAHPKSALDVVEITLKALVKNLVAIPFTIVCAPVLALVSLVSAAIGLSTLCGAKTLESLVYDAREWVGKTEKLLNWGQERTEWTRARCFQPIIYMDGFEAKWGKMRFTDTDYSDTQSSSLHAASANLARGTVQYRRKNRTGFNGCKKLEANTLYLE